MTTLLLALYSALTVRSSADMMNAFTAGEGGYACFRLPALLRLPSQDNESLGLYAEGRLKSCSDYAPIDLVYKISRDNGRTWSNVSILCTVCHKSFFFDVRST